MGIAASQARLLSITARLADVEYQTEALTASKLRLATQSSQEARNYSDTLYDIQEQRQAFLDGSIWDSNPLDTLYFYNPEFGVDGKSAKEWERTLSITPADDENYQTIEKNYRDAMTRSQNAYNRDKEAAEAAKNTAQFDKLEKQAELEHEIVLKEIKDKEAAIDMKINPLQAEHEALKTESESLKSLIKENTDTSFKLFG